MSLADRLAGMVSEYTRIAIVVMLVLTAIVGVGAPMVESSSSLDQFQSDSKEGEKLDHIEENFTVDENTTRAQVTVRGDNVLSRESLLATLRFQQRLLDNETVNATLAENDSTGSVATAVARTAISREQAAPLQQRQATLDRTAGQLEGALTRVDQDPAVDARDAFDDVNANTSVDLDDEDFATFQQATQQLAGADNESQRTAAYELGTRGVLSEEYETLAADWKAFENRETPTIQEQVEKVESMNDSEVEETVTAVLDDNGGANSPLSLMPNTYEPGSTQANATMVLVTQTSELGNSAPGAASETNIDAQLAMQDLAGQETNGVNFTVFGAGIISDEIDSSMADSLTIVGPLAMLFVLIALTVAYRDPLDILLGALGIIFVLVWTFGLMGWTDIAFNQIFIAIPVLLIGLSIDYAIHVFMRHREERNTLAADEAGDSVAGPRGSMRVALGGVGIALLWVTATTVIGFLSNLTSPVPPIREFGIVASAGILAALLIFGVLIPALKIELDELLESYGFDRHKRAFGTGGGRFSAVLSVGSSAARRAPYIVVLLVLLLSVAGAAGGTQVSTAFEQEDFLADDPADWMKDLPEPFEPDDYTAKSTLSFVNDRFVREDAQAEILVEGNVTDPDTLQRMDTAESTAGEKNVTQTLSNGDPSIQSPLSVMESVATQNESFNQTFRAADTNGDGVPDRNLTAVYDTLFEVAPDRAGRYIYQADGEYRALRMTVSTVGGAGGEEVTTQMRDVADEVDGNGLTATATGRSVLNKIVQDQLLVTVVESLVISLVSVFLFLMVTYRISDGSASLGAVTLLPVAFSVTWILGTMFLLDIPFNVVTGMITSLTIGLGVAYSIHLSERYTQELERSDTVWEAMHTAVTGTGGALLGSAATTVGGFGVLVFAILPPLQQFGIITGLTIIYAFLGSVFILPSLLIIWTRYVGPEWAREQIATDGGEPVDADHENDSTMMTNGHGPETLAHRRVEHEHVRPAQEVEVTVTIDDYDGRIGIRETFDGTTVRVTDVQPAPVSVADHDNTLYAVWELDDEPATLTYSATVPGDAPTALRTGSPATC